MIYIENNGKISKLSTDSPTTLTHSPVKLWDMAGWSVDGLEALLNSTPYQLLIDCLPLVGGDIVKVAIVWDYKTTYGGTFTSGAWRTRDLNTEQDPDNLVSLTANIVTVAVAGRYLIRGLAPAYYVGYHQCRLLVGTTPYYGTTQYLNADVSGISVVSAVLDLVVGNTVSLEHRCNTTRATDGFGNGSLVNIATHSVLEIIKLD